MSHDTTHVQLPTHRGETQNPQSSSTSNAQTNGTYKDFYSQYFDEIKPPSSDNINFYSVKCIFHDDSKASAGFHKDTGLFHCFGCDTTLTMPQFIHRVEPSIDLPDAYRMVDQYRTERGLMQKLDSFVSHKPMPNIKWDAMVRRSHELIKNDLPIVLEYNMARGVTYDTLVENRVGYLPAEETAWGRDSLVFPYFLNGRVVGIRYRDIAMNKGGEKGCHFSLWGLDDIDDEDEIVILVEGETDKLLVHQAIQGKYKVVSSPTATFRREWKREFDDLKQVVFIPQVDEASEKMVSTAMRWLENMTVLNLPWARKQIGNDVGDWLRYHRKQELQALVETSIQRSVKHFMTGTEFDQLANEPRKWLIEGVLSQRQIGIIGGQPKAHKTWAMLNLIHSLTTGDNLLGIPQFKIVPNVDKNSKTGEIKPYKVLLIEEEGSAAELKERLEMVFSHPDTNGKIHDWRENIIIAHHLGVKLDSDVWIQRLEKEIRLHDIDLVLIDPFQRTYSVDEDSAGEMGQVWHRIATLLNMFEHLSILIIHHFNKSGTINDGWLAFRGSGRTAQEVDLGIFMEKLPLQQGHGSKLKIEGRSIPTPLAADGKEIFTLHFDNGKLSVDTYQQTIGSHGKLLAEIIERGGKWMLTEAATFFKVTNNTIKNWMAKVVDDKTGDELLDLTVAKPGKPVYIFLKDNAQD